MNGASAALCLRAIHARIRAMSFEAARVRRAIMAHYANAQPWGPWRTWSKRNVGQRVPCQTSQDGNR